MNNLHNTKWIRIFGIALLLSLGMTVIVRAASGGIDATDKWAWGTNIGWINFDPTHGSVTVYNDHLEGYIWAENIGWIRLGTYTGGDAHTYANDAFDTYGVNNDGYGNLSGYAWGTNIGWINFNPSHSQVTVDPLTGAFDGYAWSENVGWIHFKNSGTYAYNVVTSLVRSVGPGFVVNTNADTDDGSCDDLGTGSGNQDCTLREAINAANADPYDTNTITFAANYTITLTSALPDIATDLTIDGNGTANTIIQASTCDPVTLPEGCTPADWRVFTFTMGNSTIKDMTVRYGNCDASATCSGTDTTNTKSGGNIYADNVVLTLDAVNVQSGNSAIYGGGIYNYKSLESGSLTNVTFSGNLTTYGGGMFNYSSSPTVTNVTFSDNSAHSGGGGMYNYIDSNPTVTNVTFSGNSANHGGGIYNYSSSPTFSNVTFSGNSADNGGGGGMYNYIDSNPTVTNVTFSGNSASDFGGGIENESSSPTFSNVTFSGNSANSGGGMDNFASSPTLANVTFSGNSAIYGGGMNNESSSSPTLKNVIIANSPSGGDCVLDPFSSIATSANNLIEDAANACGLTDGVDGNIIGQAPLLGPLADNSGPTQTMALLPGSPAIDAGDDTVCADADTVNNLDQRGVARPFGSQCDIGAYEFDKTLVEVTIGGEIGDRTYALGTSEEIRLEYDLNAGPVETKSTTQSIATLRDITRVSTGKLVSVTSMMGLPVEALSNTYYFPVYTKNSAVTGQLLVGNVGDQATTVTVSIAGEIGDRTYALGISEEIRLEYELNAGPVIVDSSSSPVIATLRDITRDSTGKLVSVTSMMGLPAASLSDTYYFPVYTKNPSVTGQLLVGNLGGPTTVTVSIGGEIGDRTYALGISEEIRLEYDLNAGPVIVDSSSSPV
ncbi:MAG TPA: choice-of-anchor Q domain-containing protein, partial [Anaerolineales bacterium]|nr:choice-of-anchor Q domain-containing protein [Anaerolineales bacterium]